ncbi:TetR/AcrR family transcriptional regulator [Streptomyces sp. NPDC053367]|uniref:TetR/AcrR family transcriptional regulator n=1 Tax=Streptomyces sp. NPDC053367 TaxID=3365700 RepID=UPI0037D6B4B2
MSDAVTGGWRERRRAEAAAEIKAVARRLLVDGGPPAVSLRAISREIGMTASALYRYFPNLDALVVDLRADFFEELRLALLKARDQVDGDDPVERLQAMARGFRDWGLEHPQEFGLMLGPPPPGVTAPPGSARDHASMCFGRLFIGEFAELWRRGRLSTPPRDLIEERLGAALGEFVSEEHGIELPVIFVFLTAWARIYGIISMEIFGHMPWAAGNSEALFEMELLNFADQIAVGAPQHS